ncbi:MAG TPA: hypothetical protein VGQ91_02810 [Ideonella sp.]|nr:hypothetical protein [Ideonella sp.]
MPAARFEWPGAGWPHRPVGRALITLAIALVAAPALLLDAAAPSADGGLIAWHALSTLVLAGLAVWALWTAQLPRPAGRALAGLMGLLLLGALGVATQRLPSAEAMSTLDTLLPALAAAALLSIIGWRWARREILW